MPAIEILSLVAGIVSAFVACSTEYREWRTARTRRMERRRNIELQEMLEGNGPAIQAEYDDDVRRLGKVFARGDETGRAALMEQMIILQNNVITLLGHSVVEGNHSIHPQHKEISRRSRSVRDNTLTALAAQYQRLSQSRPIRRGLLPPNDYSSNNCRGTVHFGLKESGFWAFLYSHQTRSLCEDCGWHGYSVNLAAWVALTWDLQPQLWHVKLSLRPPVRGCHLFVDRFHFRNMAVSKRNQAQWMCDLCNHRPIFTHANKIFDHVKAFHNIEHYLPPIPAIPARG
ncbi:hypothetical protein MSAN_01133900 [Mycena sanguinolenta]|uniref:C2H2-type domain-containing protein n=1 Tax=Mycena sanguinolenta TaxID=230812 RepID=A0A8H6YH35_9AGAR|nr:hypothetical protein MSAN_01133900 [Mycena sanguinolenta]